ncbi:hypothetical protein [Aeromicrobium duanguangcaii]|uniref:DUF4064 domain-containing protein n=1 Tax=Aeromicrobium duanguangcaii TaxID=2968086 RepID=A0ABY5KCQ2_9ACTN|nr:hypothetical protein [Aeromicrobium duanguangcaii]MCD9155114.1 hypothetical protein [Aeromicrobium duanguangcaii]UUI68232.1 hypothetical protein NP095_13620 [Aeromicrobium duanguangcaii]
MSTPRPRSVTLACVYGGLGGIVAAFSLYGTLQNWGSIEIQESLRSSLEPVGADADALLPILRWICMGLLVAAIAATVFSFYASRGHQASRIGLTILAGLAALGFLLTGVGGLLPAILGILVVYLLWTAQAREWFAVVNGRTPLSLGTTPSVPAAGAAPASSAPDGPQPPPYDPAQYAQHPQQAAYSQQVAAPVTGARPKPVTVALLVAGIGSLIGAMVSGLVLLALVAMRDEVVKQYQQNDLLRDQLESAGVSASQMVSIGSWLFGSWLVVSLLGLVATVWAASGHRLGWWALVVASILTAGSAALGLPIGIVWMLGAIVVIFQLSRPEAKAWFHRA